MKYYLISPFRKKEKSQLVIVAFSLCACLNTSTEQMHSNYKSGFLQFSSEPNHSFSYSELTGINHL